MFFMLADRHLSSEVGLTGLSELPEFGLLIFIICSNRSLCIISRYNIGNVLSPLMYGFLKKPGKVERDTVKFFEALKFKTNA